MNLNLCLLLIGFLLLKTQIALSQDTTIVAMGYTGQKKIGISIKEASFQEKVSKYLVMMSNRADFTVVDYIDMVRLYNTIDHQMLKNDFYRMYYDVFTVMFSKPAFKALDMDISKGMAGYSKKYHLFLGGGGIGNENSQFKIDTLAAKH